VVDIPEWKVYELRCKYIDASLRLSYLCDWW